MGKIKTRYPIDINLEFYLFQLDNDMIHDADKVTVTSGPLTYRLLKQKYEQFLSKQNIFYECYMFIQEQTTEQNSNGFKMITPDFTLEINKIMEHYGGGIIIMVKSSTLYLREEFEAQFEHMNSRINELQEKMSSNNNFNIKEDIFGQVSNPLLLAHSNSVVYQQIQNKELDLAILFSEPIFDDKKNRQANMPVDFRSQIGRLYSSLSASYKEQILMDCQIGTKQHLKHLIVLKKPKILHIICHGTKDGCLEFEDDSKYALGTLQSLSSQKIREILQTLKDSLPELVFINSCYSQCIGQVFYDVGVKYVIMIDSEDKIDDEAAQIFSENFYRNIFKGEKIQFSFKEAKDSVGIKHNSFGCCCRHSSKQKHKQDCRWSNVILKDFNQDQAHRLYHIPSEKCTCQLRSLNRHKIECEWARFSLFHINNDFRIPQNEEKISFRFPKKAKELPPYCPAAKRELIICCCFNYEGSDKNILPHSESNKFKMLPSPGQEDKSQPIFDLHKAHFTRPQILNLTAPQLLENYQKVQNNCVMGRQQELFQFMKQLKEPHQQTYVIYGASGIGKTTFAIKAATYLVERQVFENYFFIDLYDIKDREMFRYKFNETTKFGYSGSKNTILSEVRMKSMVIIFDNADEFFLGYPKEFYKEIDFLKKQLQHAKIVITCKQKSMVSLNKETLHSHQKCLEALKVDIATKVLYSKIKNYIDISVEYPAVYGLVLNKKDLQIPKVIENLSHSFTNLKGKLKIEELTKKIEDIGQGDYAFNMLIETNLNMLKTKHLQSYEMLIFISQFSMGIDMNDLQILSMYEKRQNLVCIPIDKHWRKSFAILFEKYKDIDRLSELTTTTTSDTDLLENPNFDRQMTTVNIKSQKQMDLQTEIKGDSYFLEQLRGNKFIVKRFIRDFIWNRDKSQYVLYMKHLFVAYTAVMLSVYFKYLVDEKHIHEQLLEYSAISSSGIFQYKDNNYIPPNLTQSVRWAAQYNSELERILIQHPSFKEKIRNCDPSTFILNHKLDFLNIYSYEWSKVYLYLKQKRSKQTKIFITYIQQLIILIPTALKLANAEESLTQYSISKSIQLLGQIRQFSHPAQNLMITLKLKLMKASDQIEKDGEDKFPNVDFQREFHKNDLANIDVKLLTGISKQWRYEIEMLVIYREYVNSKLLKKSNMETSIKINQKINKTFKNLNQWISTDKQWRNEQQSEILYAKRQLLLCLVYFNFLQLSVKQVSNMSFNTFKKNHHQNFIKFAEDSSKVFKDKKLIKLCLRSKLISVSMQWQQISKAYKLKQGENLDELTLKQLDKERNKLKQCQEIYQNKENNLIGLTNFDMLIKKIKKEMKEKMWQQSVNSIVFMKAMTLSNNKTMILKNILRKRQTFRKEIQTIMVKSNIDVSVKYQILNEQSFSEFTKKGSTILFITTSAKKVDGKVFMIFQDMDMSEKEVEINQDFIARFPVWNCKLIVILGANAYKAVKKFSKLMNRNSPSMISITTSKSSQFDQFEDIRPQDLNGKEQDLKKLIESNVLYNKNEIEYTKQFMRELIKHRQKLNLDELKHSIEKKMVKNNYFRQGVEIHVENMKKDILELKDGKYKNLSPGSRKSHNIEIQFKNGYKVIFKKWKQIQQVFRECINQSKKPFYINIVGPKEVGKTNMLRQIGRMFIERNFFENGVYIIDGKTVEEQFDGDFDSYIFKNSQQGQMYNPQIFNKMAGPQFLIMIDDFDQIKQKSNGRYTTFLTKLKEKKVNVIFVTHEKFNLKTMSQIAHYKTIRLEKMKSIQMKILAYNILNLKNPLEVAEFEDDLMPKFKEMTTGRIIKEILQIHQKYGKKFNTIGQSNSFSQDDTHMKKIISTLM